MIYSIVFLVIYFSMYPTITVQLPGMYLLKIIVTLSGANIL